MSRRPRDQRRRAPQRSFVQRYGYQVLSALVIAVVAALGTYIYLQASRPAYACSSLLMVPPPTPTPIVTPTPLLTPVPSTTPTPTESPTPTPSPSATPTPVESPTESGSPSATNSPTESPTAIPTASPEPTATPLPTAQVGFVVTDRGRSHVPTGQTIQYAECPPTSGQHYASPAKRGYYTPDQTLPVDAWVHSLEHGLVVVLYSCGPNGNTCPDAATQAALKQLADSAPQTDVAKQCGIKNKLIVTRFDQMSTRFAAVGWDRAMLSDTFDPATFLTFYQQWVDNSPTQEAKGCDGPTGAE